MGNSPAYSSDLMPLYYQLSQLIQHFFAERFRDVAEIWNGSTISLPPNLFFLFLQINSKLRDDQDTEGWQKIIEK